MKNSMDSASFENSNKVFRNINIANWLLRIMEMKI